MNCVSPFLNFTCSLQNRTVGQDIDFCIHLFEFNLWYTQHWPIPFVYLKVWVDNDIRASETMTQLCTSFRSRMYNNCSWWCCAAIYTKMPRCFMSRMIRSGRRGSSSLGEASEKVLGRNCYATSKKNTRRISQDVNGSLMKLLHYCH